MDNDVNYQLINDSQVADFASNLLNQLNNLKNAINVQNNEDEKHIIADDVVDNIDIDQNKEIEENKELETAENTYKEFSVNDIKQKLINSSAIIFNQINLEKTKFDDIAIIQAFYGTDVKRISAAIKALNILLQSNPLPKDWIFIEYQTSRSKAVFGWLKDYKVKYIFRKIPKDSEGIFLKPAIWNIGASMTKCSKLCFIDADVAFCDSNWLEAVDKEFENYDILSLAGYVYYAETNEKTNLLETIGHTILSNNYDGHIGFTIGIKRDVYNEIGKFDICSLRHSDTLLWQKILGCKIKPNMLGWTPYKDYNKYNNGFDVKIGSTENICFHVDHDGFDQKTNEDYGKLTWYGCDYPFQEIIYQTNSCLEPKWNLNSSIGRILKNVIKNRSKNKNIADLYHEYSKKEYGKINDENPLFIVSVISKQYRIDNDYNKLIKDQLKNFSEKISNDFTYLTISFKNIELDDNLDIDVLTTYFKNNSADDCSLLEAVNSDLKFPTDSNILVCDINYRFDKNIEFTCCQKDSINYEDNLLYFNGNMNKLWKTVCQLNKNNMFNSIDDLFMIYKLNNNKDLYISKNIKKFII